MYNEKNFNSNKEVLLQKSSPENESNSLGGLILEFRPEVLDLINQDYPESQKISDWNDTEKVTFFFKKYENNPLHYFEKDNFNYLEQLNERDRTLADGVISTHSTPREADNAYDQAFPERKIIDTFNEILSVALEKYTREETARINNQEYNLTRKKMFELNLFIDVVLRLIKHDSTLLDAFTQNFKLCIDGIVKDAKKLNAIIDDSLYQKTLSFGEAYSAILSRVELKLYELSHDLKTTENKKETIQTFFKELADDTNDRSSVIDELSSITSQLNEQYNQFGKELIHELNKTYSIDNSAFEMEADDLIREYGADVAERIQAESRESQKFSAERLKRMIDYYADMANTESYHPEAMLKTRNEYEEIKRSGDTEKIENFKWLEKFERYSKEYAPVSSKEHALYKDIIAKLHRTLPLQAALEKKMDALIYGTRETRLPRSVTNFDAIEAQPEYIPEKLPLYFPVGISKDAPSWQAVFNKEKKFTKPIDLYGYMFWLNNQNREAHLVICDEIQVSNYQKRYNLTEEESRDLAQKIGDREAAYYQNIVDTFGLKNITIKRYEDFIHSNQARYDHYKAMVTRLAEQPMLKKAFLSMVQESVSGAEKEEYIDYALEELAWILSTDGTKIGHLNEARYDIVAAVIHNAEKVGLELGMDILGNPESPEAKKNIQTVCKIIRDVINERKSKMLKDSPALAYFQRLQTHLANIRIDAKLGFNQAIAKDSLTLNFVCPDVGSASFGWRGDIEEKEHVVKFKEPYSTYFYSNQTDLLVTSDQVVSTHEGLIAGKILTFDDSRQLQYAEKVIQPILKNFFIYLENAPDDYFQKINLTKTDLLKEIKQTTGLLSILRFMQKYIIKPTQQP